MTIEASDYEAANAYISRFVRGGFESIERWSGKTEDILDLLNWDNPTYAIYCRLWIETHDNVSLSNLHTKVAQICRIGRVKRAFELRSASSPLYLAFIRQEQISISEVDSLALALGRNLPLRKAS